MPKLANQIQVPTAITGVITKLNGISFCMDGSTHMIHSPIGNFRLAASFPAVKAILDSVANGATKVTVMGYPVQGAECFHISVYDVISQAEASRVLGGGVDFWPWKSLGAE